MICISVTPTSRKLAKVDLLNACRSADMVELCLDHLSKEPDIADLLNVATKPVVVSCRRKNEGGQWTGTEDQRQNMLRQAIISEPDFIELELDVANSIPRFGKTKRVVSYNSLDRPLRKIDDIIAQAMLAQSDVLKFTWPTPDLDSSWPLLAACTGKKELPIVGMALGEGSTTFSLVAHKFGSPWVYAALEQGMEAHRGQPTVGDLIDTFDVASMSPQTRLVGLLGPRAQTDAWATRLNTGMKAIPVDTRCLPFDFQNLDKLSKKLDALRIRSIVVAPGSARKIGALATVCESAVTKTGCLDLLLRQSDGWHGYNLMWRTVLTAIESQLTKKSETDRPLDRQSVLILGTNELARTMIYGVTRHKGAVMVSGPRDDEAISLAEEFGIRHVPLFNLYDQLPDVVVITEPNLPLGHRKTELNPAFLQPRMLVADISCGDTMSPSLQEAQERGCQIVEPERILEAHLGGIFKSITGQKLST